MTAVNLDSAAAIAAIRDLLDQARLIAHNLVNNADPDCLPVTAIAAEQSVEMDLRHASRDLTTLSFYLPKDGGAV